MGCANSTTSVQSTGTTVVASQKIPQHPSAPMASATPLQPGLKFDTIVIGGGIAGVAAAVQLAKSGQKVALFESNSYLGGRLKTTALQLQSGNTLQFDQGASWIHGSNKQHPITALAKHVQNLLIKQTDDDSIQIYDQNGQDVQKEAEEAFGVYEKLLKKCQKWEPSHTMEQAFQKQEQGITQDKYFMYNVANDVEFQTSGSIRNLAANGLDDDEFQGKQMLVLSGYQRFVDALASKASFDVYLNQKIKQVAWKGGLSEVLCSNGIAVSAKNVVLAVPIGVLKAKGIQFLPQLPGWKNQAINSIGFGNVCKIVVDFENGDLIKSKSHYIGVVAEDVKERGLGTYFLNLKALAGVPALMTFGLGQNADQAEQMSQNQLKNLLAKRISTFSQQKVTSQDFRITKTTWRSNQNFKGTYSYASTSTRQQHWQNMAKPIFQANWYFCGEHTTSKYRGTVHGAYLTGVYVSKWIKNKINQGNWVYPDFQKGGNKDQSSSSSSSSN